MYDNIGGKIKSLATVISFIGIAGSVIAGAILIGTNEEALGILIMLFGSLISWLSSFSLYGFGQLIENSDRLVALQASTTPIDTTEKEQALKQWKAEGLITEEEYNKKIEELHNESAK